MHLVPASMTDGVCVCVCVFRDTLFKESFSVTFITLSGPWQCECCSGNRVKTESAQLPLQVSIWMIQYDTDHAEYVHVYICVSFLLLNEEAITEYFQFKTPFVDCCSIRVMKITVSDLFPEIICNTSLVISFFYIYATFNWSGKAYSLAWYIYFYIFYIPAPHCPVSANKHQRLHHRRLFLLLAVILVSHGRHTFYKWDQWQKPGTDSRLFFLSFRQPTALCTFLLFLNFVSQNCPVC